MKHTGLTIREGAEAPRLADLTTLRLGGPVLAEVILEDPAAAAALPEIALRLGGRLAAIGAGSNILAGDGMLPLVLVRDARPATIEPAGEKGGHPVLRATGNVKLPVLLAQAARQDLAGLEGLSGIPGSVGGAVAMNAGSYGQCVGDALLGMTIVGADGVVRRLNRDEAEFAYRHMGIPGIAGWFMILEAEFRLTRAEPGTVRERGREVMERKKASQPVTAASAGCVFKNPAPGQPAGKLLDEAGFRGRRLGNMTFSSLHANFLVNEGGGTPGEAMELLAMAREAVKVRHGLSLETEVRIWA